MIQDFIVPPDSPEITSKHEYCRKCGCVIPHGQSQAGKVDKFSPESDILCPKCAEPNPVIRPLDKSRITLEFSMWVQASFDDLVAEINKGIKTYNAAAGRKSK